jgi:hypothetical protein
MPISFSRRLRQSWPSRAGARRLRSRRYSSPVDVHDCRVAARIGQLLVAATWLFAIVFALRMQPIGPGAWILAGSLLVALIGAASLAFQRRTGAKSAAVTPGAVASTLVTGSAVESAGQPLVPSTRLPPSAYRFARARSRLVLDYVLLPALALMFGSFGWIVLSGAGAPLVIG